MEVRALLPLRHLVTFPQDVRLGRSRDRGMQRARLHQGAQRCPSAEAEPAAMPLGAPSASEPTAKRGKVPSGVADPSWHRRAAVAPGPGLWALSVLPWPVKADGKLQPPKSHSAAGPRRQVLGSEGWSLATAEAVASGSGPGGQAWALAEGRGPGLTHRPAASEGPAASRTSASYTRLFTYHFLVSSPGFT